MGQLSVSASVALLVAALGAACATTDSAATVSGAVKLDGDAPALKEFILDATMQRATGERIYREESWLVGADRGLANCVVTLKAKVAGTETKPLARMTVDKVGVRYVPHVLVVTPGTEVVLRNKESPCHGFHAAGLKNDWNYMVQEGTEQKVTMRGPDRCMITCPVRPYVLGYIVVVDTPYFAVTNAEGNFVIRDVPAGEYQVTVWHEVAGKLTKDAGPMEINLTAAGDQALRYKVKPKDTVGK